MSFIRFSRNQLQSLVTELIINVQKTPHTLRDDVQSTTQQLNQSRMDNFLRNAMERMDKIIKTDEKLGDKHSVEIPPKSCLIMFLCRAANHNAIGSSSFSAAAHCGSTEYHQ